MKLIESGSPVRDPDVVEYLRTYRIATELGIAPSQQDVESAVTLDWLLKIHEAVIKRQNEAMGA